MVEAAESTIPSDDGQGGRYLPMQLFDIAHTLVMSLHITLSD